MPVVPPNLGRIAVFLAGLPQSVGGTTVNRFCGSSMQSIHMAAGTMQLEAGEAFICAGVESMTRVPMTGFNPAPHPGLQASDADVYISMGQTAENLANKYGISRQEQQEFAVASHAKAHAAREDGRFDDEIVPIVAGNLRVEADGAIREDTSQEVLDALEPAFNKAGSVTAGTSSPLTDGAAAVLVCSEDYADRNGLPKLARVKSIAVSGCAPEIMGIGPVDATTKALARAGLAPRSVPAGGGRRCRSWVAAPARPSCRMQRQRHALIEERRGLSLLAEASLLGVRRSRAPRRRIAGSTRSANSRRPASRSE